MSTSLPSAAASIAARHPLLATAAQRKAEQTLLHLLKDPEIRRVQAELTAEVGATPRGQSAAGAATLARAIQQWTCSLAMGELSALQASPSLLWTTDDTPHSWLGYDLPGIGTSVDNPDAIYRSAVLDGAQNYELVGKLDLARRPTQIVIELHNGVKTTPPSLDPKNSDLTPLGGITDKDLVIAPDGSFRVTVGPQSTSPVHLTSKPGRLTLGIRDILGDWTQAFSLLEVRQLSGTPPTPASDEQILAALLRDLPPYIRFWSRFPDIWSKGKTGNVVQPPHARNGPMSGFVASLNFDLAPDEAIVLTMVPGKARYTGFQITDPWLIASDARAEPVCLNIAQSTPNADGSFTYVLSSADPGVANWLSTGGVSTGAGALRWQAVPDVASVDPATMIRDFQVVRLKDLPPLPRVTAEQRAAQMAARVEGYNRRSL